MKTLAAILVGKIIFIAIRVLKLGGGSAAPGHFALKIEPDLVSKLARQIPENVIITGTNGKTTTAKLLALFAKDQNIKVLQNSTGSNMERGIASKLVEECSLFGRIKEVDLGVWESDEASFNKLAIKLRPKIIIFLNAARDQLDRYGEFDTLVSEWRETLQKLDFKPLVLVNADDASTLSLASYHASQTFGADKKIVQSEKESMGKINKDFEAIQISDKGLNGFAFTIKTRKNSFMATFPISGLYHVYSFMAAFAAGTNLNLNPLKMLESVKRYQPAFGRVEQLKIGGKDVVISLIKNPSGATAVFETVKSQLKTNDRILLALNDNLADGTDVSWIWDAGFEELRVKSEECRVFCTGARAEDLALRLKYAGFDEKQLTVESNIASALDSALKGLDGKLFIMPTYTALLEFQKILASKGVKEHYWKDKN